MDIQPAREFKDICFTVPWGHVVGRWYGNRQVRPLLAVHGWLDNLGTWDTIIPLLPPHIGVLCIDLPGHGHSSRYPKGTNYHFIYFIPLIQRIMQLYGWQKVSLLGHSLGALICFVYASMCPDTVDMMISIDVLIPFIRSPDFTIKDIKRNTEKHLVEDERPAWLEPPSYTYDELQRLQYEGTARSVELDKCKHILGRNIAKSSKYPDKFYFSRDARVKFTFEMYPSLAQVRDMISRLYSTPFMVIKAANSVFIDDVTQEFVELLRKQNPLFELHEVRGTHHVHLNNAKEVAAVLNPFINRHRPEEAYLWPIREDYPVHYTSEIEEGMTRGKGIPRSKL